MVSMAKTLERRNKVSLCLAKSMTNPIQIANQINEPIARIRNDLHWMRHNSKKWLSGHTLDGYIWETRKTIDQLSDIIMDLQAMRSVEKDVDRKLRIIHELADKINMKWVIQGDGPTLMNIRSVTGDGR